MSDIAIRVENLSKVYKLYDKPLDRLKESISPFRKKYHKDFYSLKDVTFTVEKGKTLGVIGKNGAGKSTLLKLLTGVLTQTSGILTIDGKVVAILELGGGFNPEYTGIENIYLNSSLMGISRAETEKRLEGIVEFADIGEFINQPVKAYSSGMIVRLAFSLIINSDPDILIIDEALSVGDMSFQKKCMEKINCFRNKGKTIVFCSHDMHAVNEISDTVVWLKDSHVMGYGEPSRVINEYISYMTRPDNSENVVQDKASANANYFVRNSNVVEICDVTIKNSDGVYRDIFMEGENLNIEVEFVAFEPLVKPHVNVAVFRDDKVLVCLTSTSYNKSIDRKSYEVGKHIIRFTLPNIPLNRGLYILGISIWDNSKKIVFANNISKEFSIKTLKVVFGPTSDKMVYFPEIHWDL